MSVLKICLLMCLLALAPAAHAAEESATEDRQAGPEQLYEALAAARSPLEARTIEARIFALWAQTESPSEALIFEQSAQLVAQGAFEHAKQKLDVLTDIAPGYVEGWSFRALVNRKVGHYDQASTDLRRVLQSEPKHFRALALLGSIFEELDDPKSALKAFEAAVEINPHLEGGEATVRRLTEEVKGRGI